MEDALRAYLERVVSVFGEELGDRVSSVLLIGSLAGGDFHRGRSDIDLLVVVSGSLSKDQKSALATALSHAKLPCPAHGLDLVLYSEAQVSRPNRIPRYEFSLATGVEWSDDVSYGGPYPGGLIDLAAARQYGRVLHGAPPAELLGPVSPLWIQAELHSCILWHRGKLHDPFHDPSGSNAVLNACRALYFLEQGRLVSKTEGARAFAGHDPAGLVPRALAERGRSQPDRLPKRAVLDFLEMVAGELRGRTA